MAKSQGKQPKQDKEFDKLMEEEFGEKKKPETVHLGDTAALKRALDDAAVEASRTETQLDLCLTISAHHRRPCPNSCCRPSKSKASKLIM